MKYSYATANSFKGAKTVKANAKATSTTLKKLTKNKKYYVRVRSYKTVKVNGKNKTIYSAWSANKTLSTRKNKKFSLFIFHKKRLRFYAESFFLLFYFCAFFSKKYCGN